MGNQITVRPIHHPADPTGPIRIRPHLGPDGATVIVIVTNPGDAPEALAAAAVATLASQGIPAHAPVVWTGAARNGLATTIRARANTDWIIIAADPVAARASALAADVAAALDECDDDSGAEGPVRIRPFWAGKDHVGPIQPQTTIWTIRGDLGPDDPPGGGAPAWNELASALLQPIRREFPAGGLAELRAAARSAGKVDVICLGGSKEAACELASRARACLADERRCF